MGATDKSVVSPRRLKREEYKSTKHDFAFSDWKILIGPSDWEDHLLKKDGAEKYRTQNLPNCSSCPGLYELGIAVSCPRNGREFGKLKSNFIIPVYLGQAKNVRTRLQRYGREGAHLENGSPNSELNDSRGKGLFTEIFSRGFPIVYRWAPMKSKKDAEEMEARLLDTFDYAWNRGSNGARRPNDIHQKLDCNISSAWSHPIVRKLQIYRHRKLGLRIKTCENESSFYSNQESNSIFSRIFKFGKSRPVLVSVRCDVNEDSSNICGVALGQGSVCIRPPVQGRKRCSEHKGMKVNGSPLQLKVSSQMIDTRRVPVFVSDPGSLKLQPGKCPVNEDLSSTCGIALNDGSFCTRKPVRVRKRCTAHKGRKNHGYVSKPVKEEKKHCVDVPSLEPSSLCDGSELLHAGTHRLQSSDFTERTSVHRDYGICREPIIIENVPCINEDYFTCGSRTLDGSFCRRKPGKGSKWCWQHQGKRVDRISRVSACNESTKVLPLLD